MVHLQWAEFISLLTHKQTNKETVSNFYGYFILTETDYQPKIQKS